MKNVFRRIRGMLGVGVTWGGLWAGIGGGIGIVIGIVNPGAWSFANPIWTWAVGMGLYGVVSGVGFAVVLSVIEARRTLRDLSLARVALWGVLGAAAVPWFFGALGMFDAGTTMGEIVGAMLVTSGLGGTFAPGAVAIARRAELPPVSTSAELHNAPGFSVSAGAGKPNTVTR